MQRTLKGFICYLIDNIITPSGQKIATIAIKNGNGKIYNVIATDQEAEELVKLCASPANGGHKGEIITCVGKFIPARNPHCSQLPYEFYCDSFTIQRKNFRTKTGINLNAVPVPVTTHNFNAQDIPF